MTLNQFIGNSEVLEELYNKYLEDPNSIDPSWKKLFQEIDGEGTFQEVYPHIDKTAPSDLRIYHLIEAYRTYGHFLADINPIATHPPLEPYQLNLKKLGFSSDELQNLFPTCGLFEKSEASLQEIIESLRETYCDKIGIEYMGLQNPKMEDFLQSQIEPKRFKIDLTIDQKKSILQHLNRSELLEIFLHTKYTGQKRFSLEGGETLIPMLGAILDSASDMGTDEFIIGMAHRGRLNVLSNIMDKSYKEIFSEFEEGYIPDSIEGSGDVKYHKGFTSKVITLSGKEVNVVLAPNPSHLEAVNPVVEGMVCARQMLRQNEAKHLTVMPILVHGDAAITGQGVVYETMQLYDLDGYSTGGTIHIVINNQIGFTALPSDTRSTHYCTDIARSFCAPVFHVNAEDPEGCVYATLLAVKLRQQFQCDVFIDLNCYRKYGHNEGDEPAFTQPLEYQLIRKKKAIREIYRDNLIQQGVLERQVAKALEIEFKEALVQALEKAQDKSTPHPVIKTVHERKVDYAKNIFNRVETEVKIKTLQELSRVICHVPDDFNIHRKLGTLIKSRLNMASGKKPLDWGMAEMLAYASVLNEGKHVRLVGQDCCRGTFSHRHAMWMDQVQEHAYFPLKEIKNNHVGFIAINSPISEFAALGFEYGYSIGYPESLVVWEAQFGDFCNGAQVIIDQFISTSEQKWGQQCGLVMLLPHGYEGQGPEHSSARIERFLTLSGDKNMLVCNPSSPHQLFHLLRRQVLSPVRKPLIVFTPKGLLRHPECVSTLEQLSSGTFEEVVDDPNPPKKVKKVVLCSGRIYYDLIAEREKSDTNDMAIIRIEQLYPLHKKLLRETLEKYTSFERVIWVQEEPNNMGAWNFIRPRLRDLLPKNTVIYYVGRARSASPAAGSFAMHQGEHAALLDALFRKEPTEIFEKAYYYNV